MNENKDNPKQTAINVSKNKGLPQLFSSIWSSLGN